MRCIDTHVHIWNFNRAEYAWLRGNTSLLGRSYLIGELEAQRQAAGVTEGLLVQAANTEEETQYMLEVAEETPWLKGVVGWLPLTKPAEVERILATGYATHRLFKGVRHLIHDEPDAKWLLQPPVLESLALLAVAGLPYDVVGILPAHLETVLKVADKVPALSLVLDHLNQPPIKSGEKFGRWGELMAEAAKHKNVYAKISGLGTTAGKGEAWGEEDIKPYLSFALESFGAERCFCGGDWPVSLLAGPYTHAWLVYKQTLSSVSNQTETDDILYANAKRFYRL